MPRTPGAGRDTDEMLRLRRDEAQNLRDLNTRLRYRLFEAGKNESVHALIEEVTCRSSRRRVSLKTLLGTVRKP